MLKSKILKLATILLLTSFASMAIAQQCPPPCHQGQQCPPPPKGCTPPPSN